MKTRQEFLKLADACLKLSIRAENPEHRKLLLELATEYVLKAMGISPGLGADTNKKGYSVH
jgi:hypothetical protein